MSNKRFGMTRLSGHECHDQNNKILSMPIKL